MKEAKSFFTKGNRLNKGYDPERVKRVTSFHHRFTKNLPPVDVISAYEDMHEGSTGKFLDLVEKEQLHKHKMEAMTIETYKCGRRMGQICGLLSVGVVGYVELSIIKQSLNKGIIFAVCALGVIALISVLNYFMDMNAEQQKGRIRKG